MRGGGVRGGVGGHAERWWDGGVEIKRRGGGYIPCTEGMLEKRERGQSLPWRAALHGPQMGQGGGSDLRLGPRCCV
jgi:hypothetical protein